MSTYSEYLKKKRAELLELEEANNIIQGNTTENLSEEFNAVDTTASGATGIAHSLTYIMDLPSLVGKAVNFAMGQTVGRGWEALDIAAREAMGQDETQIALAKEKFANMRKWDPDIEGYPGVFEPGELIRDKIFTYEPKTKIGKYTQAAGEWAGSGGVFGALSKVDKLGKGIKLFSTGAVSGVAEQAVTDASNEAVGVGAGLAVNIPLDILALRKGNASSLIANLAKFTDEEIKAIKIIQQNAKNDGLYLSVGEASNKLGIIKLEGNLDVATKASDIISNFYKTRPDQVQKYIINNAQKFGLITDSSKLSKSQMLNLYKKTALLLTERRTKLWEKAGGNKFAKELFPKAEINKVIKSIDTMIANPANNKIVSDLESYRKMLLNAKNDGRTLHGILREIRQHRMFASQNPNATLSDQKLIRSAKEIEKSLDNIFLTYSKQAKPGKKFSNYALAQKKYKAYTKAMIEPLDRTKLFKDIKVAGWENDVDKVAKVFKYLSEYNLSSKDVEKLAKTMNVAKDGKAWQKVVSYWFEDSFLKASLNFADEGLNFGALYAKALTGSPRKLENFTTMMFTMAKQKGYKGTYADMLKATKTFSNVLRASSNNAKTGSNTMNKAELLKSQSANITDWFKGIPIFTYVNNKFSERALSKNSEALAKALTSPRGIDAFIQLAEHWKEPAKVFAAIRAVMNVNANTEEFELN